MSDTPQEPPAAAPDLSAEEEAEFAALADQVALNLRLGRPVQAQRASEELLKRWPHSTTSHELAGDVAIAIGQTAQARAHYKQALELEPANADAERKYGAALLAQTPEERRAALIAQVIADPAAHRAGARRPLNAVLNALLFPGLGQLYNHEQEKGLGILSGAAVILMLLFYVAVQVPYSVMVEQAGGRKLSFQEQVDRTLEVAGQLSAGHHLLVALLILVYLALYGWGIYDAWKHAQSEDEQALGVR